MKTIRDMNDNCDEWKLFMTAISQLSGHGEYTKMEPHDIVIKIHHMAEYIYAVNEPTKTI